MYILIKLKSSKSYFFYLKKKNKKNNKKISLLKFDPIIKKRIIFNEEKI
ncbi:50S ribosomal protein L33 [Candidatus Carsonella ruddii]|uniref:Large ribosomal subunit protein bL33 n=1 Tax=Candidatus Carsonella ruddii HC isolate Thao2000 TaxID=1202538 RepID=J3TEA6_CARRU|nr:50S ribosomal protein L33 [Candidatus Carsonella ruddii]AFP83982.1 ribosomal protein L33 [Candidatus Carsonella ruddii HC isolate Thao2000]